MQTSRFDWMQQATTSMGSEDSHTISKFCWILQRLTLFFNSLSPPPLVVSSSLASLRTFRGTPKGHCDQREGQARTESTNQSFLAAVCFSQLFGGFHSYGFVGLGYSKRLAGTQREKISHHEGLGSLGFEVV